MTAMGILRVGATALALMLAAAPVQAQRRLQPRAAPVARGENGARRAELERQFRQRGEQLVRQQLNLSDDQMRRLRAVNSQFDGPRRELLLQERDARIALRDELGRGSSADQQRVAQLIAQVRQLQGQRFALQQQEQQQLAGFLTPVQQAQYDGLVARLRQRARELRAQQEDTAPQP